MGRRGQALALGLTALVAILIWFGAVSPVLDWYGARADTLNERQVLAARMASVAASEPALRRQSQGLTKEPRSALLEGATEAIASATLQQRVQEMADRTGVRVSSTEALPVEQAGAYRRIRLHVAVTGPWAQLVGLFSAIDAAAPRMLVDDLQIGASSTLTTAAIKPLDASFTVIALYPGKAPA
jgi:general secretion pathway protein M